MTRLMKWFLPWAILVSAPAAAQLLTTYVGSGSFGGGGGGGAACLGVIDASAGCPMPMVGM
jgi:hypothetical protein